jgi:hypothetical protein
VSYLSVEGVDDEGRDEEREGDRPPGQFMDEQLADDTARFLAEVKRLAKRRREQPDEPESWSPPPT